MKTKDALLTALCSALALTSVRAADKPNIVFIMADDLGNADVGYHGARSKRRTLTSSPPKAFAWNRSMACPSALRPARR
ncbi:MAG: hypothetical protein ACLQAH_04830 [Limisphaerales bacterium]